MMKMPTAGAVPEKRDHDCSEILFAGKSSMYLVDEINFPIY